MDILDSFHSIHPTTEPLNFNKSTKSSKKKLSKLSKTGIT